LTVVTAQRLKERLELVALLKSGLQQLTGWEADRSLAGRLSKEMPPAWTPALDLGLVQGGLKHGIGNWAAVMQVGRVVVQGRSGVARRLQRWVPVGRRVRGCTKSCCHGGVGGVWCGVCASIHPLTPRPPQEWVMRRSHAAPGSSGLFLCKSCWCALLDVLWRALRFLVWSTVRPARPSC
jgi:hypothetical protein